MAEELKQTMHKRGTYDESKIRHLDDTEHIRTRPGMYIGRLGDGSHAEDGIYVLLKESIDNSIDEFNEGFGKRIEVSIDNDRAATIRDYGRGIPLGSLVDAVSKLNTGAKYDTSVFTASVGLNGVGLKAVNALSLKFVVRSYREGRMHEATFERGRLQEDHYEDTHEEDGTYVYFEPDPELFLHFHFEDETVDTMLRNYTYLNTGLAIFLNGRRIISRNGLEDLLNDNMTAPGLYPIIHLKGDNIDIAFTHTSQYGEEYYSFVNGQHTTLGGTHQSAFKEHIARTIKEHFGKNFDVQDVRNGLVAAISVRVIEPMFESQTKIKLGSLMMAPTKDKDGHPFPLSGVSVNKFVGDFIKEQVDNYLHKNLDTAEVMLQKIQDNERDRKAMAGVTKLARERAKKANLHNAKLRDCRIHLNEAPKKGYDKDNDPRFDSSLFITEGNSASGSITKSRDANTQAVFSLRGKPLNCFGKTKEVVYKNEEFSLLQSALNIEDGLDGLRYNKVIVATDADVDGMHIRLLMITFFLQFFPELIKKGHVYILQTPLFRVRNKVKSAGRRKQQKQVSDDAAGAAILKKQKSDSRSDYETIYCYTEEERLRAIERLGPDPEITRFKGLGEISPDEFKHFIGPEIRLEQVTLHKSDQVGDLLEYYMGKNTMERQEFIIDNLVVEEDLPDAADETLGEEE
ncbi:DNA topoisomerase IV subunit B [Alloprevotella tannerae]|uniref:DNA topoisomerase (ATP-hydrolyzing) n=2 Tax=Alloprevotella tannerae TaxID=76122 RepID=A0A929RXY3_9BACT|nr:DNA topoisomerase IV subunit B [Alloprevotella tannerae]MBF0970761.1 type IIA DNA topoisomerase subunit B [Alloprevotella tannerae]